MTSNYDKALKKNFSCRIFRETSFSCRYFELRIFRDSTVSKSSPNKTGEENSRGMLAFVGWILFWKSNWNRQSVLCNSLSSLSCWSKLNFPDFSPHLLLLKMEFSLFFSIFIPNFILSCLLFHSTPVVNELVLRTLQS